MLVSEYTKPLTVEMLIDIIDSQRCLWGDSQLVTKPELDCCVEFFAEGESVIQCMDNDSMIEDYWKLSFLEVRLKRLSKKAQKSVIQMHMDVSEKFQVGFNTEDGFIELINTDEVQIIPTPVNL